MRAYDLVFIAHPDLDENAFRELVEKVQSWITESGGQVTKIDIWGRRRLAYPIKKLIEGQYVFFQTEMAPSFETTLDRNLRFTESVIRYLITSN